MSELKADGVATSAGEEDGVAASREGLVSDVNLPAAVVESLESHQRGTKNDDGDGGCGGGDVPPLTCHPPPLPPSGNTTDDADVAAAISSGAAAAAAEIAPSPHPDGGGAVGGGSDTATNNPSTSSDDNAWMVVGARCSIPKRGSGTVRWKGVIGTKDRVGVELDEPNGLNDGSTPSGIVLFRCKPMHGVFVIPSIVEQPAAVTMPTTAGASAAAAAAVGAESGKRSPVVRPPVVARAIEIMRERRGEMVDEERILPALVSQFGKEVRALDLHAACRACLACHLPHVPCVSCVCACAHACAVRM
jgi:hypothetical protein